LETIDKFKNLKIKKSIHEFWNFSLLPIASPSCLFPLKRVDYIIWFGVYTGKAIPTKAMHGPTVITGVA